MHCPGVFIQPDLPTILSGDKLAYLEPHEEIWKKETGQWYNVHEYTDKRDTFAPFYGYHKLSVGDRKFSGTFFRFPLRTISRERRVSPNTYDISKLREILVALCEEANVILLFLRSVCTVEVHEIFEDGSCCDLLKVSVKLSDIHCHQRIDFHHRMKEAFTKCSYKMDPIELTVLIQVNVTDEVNTDNSTHSSWLVASRVGSRSETVHGVAEALKALPWVGVALRTDSEPSGGRVFCVLPMPSEVSCHLPVHVNATFSLNDERRELKWSGIERKNDKSAGWNRLIIRCMLPPCYAGLLLNARKHLRGNVFYKAWPNVNEMKLTQWKSIIEPLFQKIFSCKVFLSYDNEWVGIKNALFTPREIQLPNIVTNILSASGEKIVTIPSNVWDALSFMDMTVTSVTPQNVRSKLKYNRSMYDLYSSDEKLELLRFIISDGCFHDLLDICLLPLADGTFTSFLNNEHEAVYLCSSQYPPCLIPGCKKQLVHMKNDNELLESLVCIANSGSTQLKMLDGKGVSSLLQKCLPRLPLITLPHPTITLKWLEIFWEWVSGQKKIRKFFSNLLVVPVYNRFSDATSVVQLSPSSPSLFIPSTQSVSNELFSALTKLHISCCEHSTFPYLCESLVSDMMNRFSADGVFDALYFGKHYSNVVFTTREATELKQCLFLYQQTPTRRSVLEQLAIFTTLPNTDEQLYSRKQASSAQIEPKNFPLSAEYLPSELILFSSSDLYQVQLLKSLSILHPTCSNLLVNSVFPLIHGIHSPNTTPLMKEILMNIHSIIPNSTPKEKQKLRDAISILPFLPVLCGTPKPPISLFDPSDALLQQLFQGKPVFPLDPFQSDKCLAVLRSCGLRTKVSAQGIVNIIQEIGTTKEGEVQYVDKTTYARAQAVLEYMKKWNKSTLSEEVKIEVHSYSLYRIVVPLSRRRCWLPVKVNPIHGYPESLSWKGSNYTCHLSSYGPSTILSEHGAELELACGTQMYFIDHSLPKVICEMFNPDPNTLVQHVMAHFESVCHSSRLSTSHMRKVTQAVYQLLQKHLQYTKQHMTALSTASVYIARRNIFVSPNVVAIGQNNSFRQNLEPFIYILPDDLLCFSSLFKALGVVEVISKDQIVAILGKIKDGNAGSLGVTNEEAWELVMNILNWLTGNGKHLVDTSDSVHLCVPIEPSSAWPTLVESTSVVYTDNDFLRRSMRASQSSEQRFEFVNKRISPQMARLLRLAPLSQHLDIAEDAFEDVGQSEPLKVRLKNILKEYKDGLTIVKELIQNADDACATEVNICYDARNHRVSPGSLFFPGMAGCHGPALVVHNNAMFTQEDFRNITKLAGASKECQTLKIGKFGVGFCSVYHMTDIPSFISNQYLYIFDPTLTYLKEEVTNPAQPGKKVVFTTNIFMNSEQLAPYQGLFNFEKEREYKGTMFRFPFRTSPSELSERIYTSDEVTDMFEEIQQNSSELILFLQNINCITVSQIRDDQESPAVVKTIKKTVTKLESVNLIMVICSSCNSESITKYWLVSSHTETVLCQLATASIACSLQTPNLIPQAIEGEVFCFLPLTMKTGLPVHISSNFAVRNNRTGIWTSDNPSNSIYEVKWNESLMNTVIPEAYFKLLLGLKQMSLQNSVQNYIFYVLWPLKADLTVQNPWKLLVSSLYDKFEKSSDALFFSACITEWLSLEKCQFLKPDILSHSSSSVTPPESVLEITNCLKLPIVDLPQEYQAHFNRSHCNTLDEKAFLGSFFGRIKEITSVEPRNEVLCLALECFATELDHNAVRKSYLLSYLTSNACIPTAPHGQMLRKCSDMISPNATFSKLYEEEDGLFPLESFCSKQLVSKAMEVLGIISSTLPMHMLRERAKSVSLVYNKDKCKALKRSQLIQRCLCFDSPEECGDETLADIPFLPVMPKPEGYSLEWFGEHKQLLSGKELMLKGETNQFGDQRRNIYIAGSQVPFTYEVEPEKGGCGYLSFYARKALKIRITPTPQEVIDHFTLLLNAFQSQTANREEMVKGADTIARNVYRFLEDQLTKQLSTTHEASDQKQPNLELSGLSRVPCIWTGKQFIWCDNVAVEWKLTDGPYLYRVPDSIRGNLREALNIKNKFTFHAIVKGLQEISADYDNTTVSNTCQRILADMISELNTAEVPEFHSQIMLPDENFVMHKASELAFNDAQWFPQESGHTYVNHKLVTRDLADKLGVKMVRNKTLERFKRGFKSLSHVFGQKEKLTSRIQGILHDYPFDVTILKELLQNADDARATKLYVILDPRVHKGERILSQKWQELQGPALLVWNDSEFTEDDIDGIQKLGVGNKRSSAEMIGQYGIGFNSVYHLTDCPSFIAGGKTFCIFDPHCRYTPDSTQEFPGERLDATDEFWSLFPDMKPAYLRSKVYDCPKELLRGSLFRFPLRHTQKMADASEILGVNRGQKIFEGVLSADKMRRYLKHWAPQIKQSMFFLNFVTEIKFFTVTNEDSYLKLEQHYRVDMDKSAAAMRVELHKKVRSFNNTQSAEPFLTKYQLSLIELGGARDKKEEWLIQQGIGDIDNKEQEWLYIDQVKPRHGIAAPLDPPSRASVRFCGKVFCFLPLPIDCNLPVHINGHFILHSSRRGLWKTTDKDDIDSKQQWNTRLLNAIASSYAHFLMAAKSDYKCESGDVEMKDVKRYYNVFPSWTAPPQITQEYTYHLKHSQPKQGHSVAMDAVAHTSKAHSLRSTAHVLSSSSFTALATYSTQASVPTPALALPTEEWRQLAENVFRLLSKINAHVLAVVHSTHTRTGQSNEKGSIYRIEWCPLKHEDPASQAFFDSSGMDPPPKAVLERVGMKLSCTPHWVRKHLKHIQCCVPTLSPKTAYDYYCNFNKNILPAKHSFPCPVVNTSFISVDDFKCFLKYISSAIPIEKKKFPANNQDGEKDTEDSPANGTPTSSIVYPPLLVTADGILRCCNNESDSKVIKSAFSSLFQECLQCFLHPKLKECKIPQTFLLNTSSGEDETCCLDKIHHCLASILPGTLADTQCVQSPRDIQFFKLLWDCLSSKDEIFNYFLTEILERWALLLGSDNKLYSCCLGLKAIVPIIPPSMPKAVPTVPPEVPSMPEASEDDNVKEISMDTQMKVCSELKRLKVPFLNTNIVPSSGVEHICPTLYKPECILQLLYHYHCQLDISHFITENMSKVLIDYFGNIHLKKDDQSLTYLKNLPLFLTHTGEFTSLGKTTVYIWPSDMIADGQDIWLKGQNVIFLDYEGAWSTLGLSSELRVHCIHPMDIYTQFIFDEFKCMDEMLRYSHLQYIRDSLFRDAVTHYEMKHSGRHYQSTQFLHQLRALECIGSTGARLQSVQDHYDCRNTMFKTFQDKFLFLPILFRKGEEVDTEPTKKELKAVRESNSWRKFFIKLGLHAEITTTEYLQLCQEVADGQHTRNTKEKSHVLFQHLFEDVEKPLSGPLFKDTTYWDKDWFSYNFTSRVVHIPFVLADEGTGYTWIAPVERCGTHMIQTEEGEDVYLTTLDGACRYEDITLVWSVKPVFRVPDEVSNRSSIFHNLSLNYKATAQDVVKHLVTISKTGRADQNLFETYTAVTPGEDDKVLIDVIAECFNFLNTKLDDSAIDILSKSPCIPIPAAESTPDKVVLVKPCQALTTENLQGFFPYLHRVPSELMCAMKFLERIGVKNCIKLFHLQLVLQLVYDQLQKRPMDPNTMRIVCLAINCLNVHPSNNDEAAHDLSPLFLPGHDNCLHDSQSLVYPDMYSYKDCQLPVNALGYCLLHHPNTHGDQFDFANGLCNKLPLTVRPKPMSELCCQELMPECNTHAVDVEMAKCLKIAIKLCALPVACQSMFRSGSKYENLEEDLSCFFQRVEVVTVTNLAVNIVLKSNGSTIGTANVDFFLDQRQSTEGPTFCLYLDSNIGRMEEEHIYSTLTQELLQEIGKCIKGIPIDKVLNENVQKAFRLFLKSQTDDDIRNACRMRGIGLDGSNAVVHAIILTAGREIPLEWHYMLDQNPYHVFHPQEFVGYEKSTGCFIIAQVLYAIPPEDYQQPENAEDTVDPTQMRYMIAISDGTKELVTALCIHKFLKGCEIPSPLDDPRMTSDEGAGQQPHLNAAEAKKLVCKQLKQIWRMSEPERSTAIRRLYLQWHPDKNLDNVAVADEVFKYITKQIERLDQGLEVQGGSDDADEDDNLVSPSPYWEEKYRQWERTAKSHKQHRTHHYEYFRNRSGSSHNAFDAFEHDKSEVNLAKAKLWTEQAAFDLRALNVLYEKATSTDPQLSSHVCFMAHEVAEKALKGGMYATCGLSPGFLKNHNISYLARALRGERMQLASELPSLTDPLVPHYLNTRFPNCCGNVPSLNYSITTAEQARTNAQKILVIVMQIIRTCTCV